MLKTSASLLFSSRLALSLTAGKVRSYDFSVTVSTTRQRLVSEAQPLIQGPDSSEAISPD
jgi:hypothetical protein